MGESISSIEERMKELQEERRIAREWISDAKAAAYIAFCLSLIVLIFSFWILAKSQGSVEEFSPISFSLALLQTILALGAFGGFWLVRDVAINRSKEEARKTAIAETTKCLDDRLTTEVNAALTKLFKNEDGKAALAKAVSEPRVVAAIAVAIKQMGLDDEAKPKAAITNPGKSGQGQPEQVNELHLEFWRDIADRDKKRFLKPYEEPPFEE